MITSGSIDLPQATLDPLVFRTLPPGPLHGWAVSERIQQISGDVLRVQQGSFYPALYRLERRGWIKARWVPQRRIAERSSTSSPEPDGGSSKLELAAVVSQILETA